MGMASNRTRQKNPKNRRNKVNLVFDEAKRREFLTGFRKRKLQRKKYAKEKLEKEFKEERKRLKKEVKESYQKLVVSHRTIPELENLLTEQYEDDEVTVKITELSTSEIAKQNNWIGPNLPRYETDNEEESKEESEEEELVPGMELKKKKYQVPKEKVITEKEFNSQKDIKKVLKKQAAKNVKKSKIYQKKNKMDQIKQKKKAIIKRKEMMKFEQKRHKHKGKKQS